MKLNYYARLKEDNVCIEIVSTPENLKNVKGYVSIPDYNPTLLYKKWENSQWSSERYEPEIDSVIQDRLNILEEENQVLNNQVSSLSGTISGLNGNIELLEGTINELMMILEEVLK